jgi:hypothetical protein
MSAYETMVRATIRAKGRPLTKQELAEIHRRTSKPMQTTDGYKIRRKIWAED